MNTFKDRGDVVLNESDQETSENRIIIIGIDLQLYEQKRRKVPFNDNFGIER